MYEVGEASPSPEKAPSTSKFLKKLKARNKAMTMDQVDERNSEHDHFSDYGEEE